MVVLRRTGNIFAAQVGRDVLELKDYTKRVWQESLLDFVMRMQRPVGGGGSMPVLTGFLRASLMVSTSPVPVLSFKKPTGEWSFGWSMSDVFPVIKSLKLGDTAYFGYGAEYANVLELRYGFQRLAIQSFPSIVEQVKTRLGG